VSLDVGRLEKVKQSGGKIIARCPACARAGGDKKGVHLSILPGGKFTCVAFQGASGADHRREIFALAGIQAENDHAPVKVRVFRPGSGGGGLRTLRTGPAQSYAYGDGDSFRGGYSPKTKNNPSDPSENAPTFDLETGFPIIDGAICPF